MIVRAAHAGDTEAIWSILKPVIRAGETYALPRDWSREETLAYWFTEGHAVFVAEEGIPIGGTYFLQANQRGGGAHVANCGYVTAFEAGGRGVARGMCEHSMEQARSRGFRAMQFNFVVSTNERALRLWKRLGFEIVGTLPDAFEHPRLGFVDAFVLYRKL